MMARWNFIHISVVHFIPNTWNCKYMKIHKKCNFTCPDNNALPCLILDGTRTVSVILFWIVIYVVFVRFKFSITFNYIVIDVVSYYLWVPWNNNEKLNSGIKI